MLRASASGSLAFWMGGIVLAVAAGGAWYFGRTFLPQDALVPAPSVSSRETASQDEPANPATVPVATTDDRDGQAESASASEPAGPKPRLDEVRHESDGLVVIAGRVAPFADVILRLDGSELARASADGSGAFATVAMLEPSDAARILTLSQFDEAGGEIDADDELILAPVRAPAPERPAAQTDTETAKVEAPVATLPSVASVDEEAGTTLADAAVQTAPIAHEAADSSEATPSATAERPLETGTEMLAAVQDRPAPDEDGAAGTEDADLTAVTLDATDPSPLADPDPDVPAAIAEAADRAEAKVAPVAVTADVPADAAAAITATDPIADASLRETPLETTGGTGTTTDSQDLAAEAAPAVATVAETIEIDADPETGPSTAAVPAAATINGPALSETAPAGTVASTLPLVDAETAQSEETPPGNSQQFAILRSNEDGVTVVRPAAPRPQVMRQVALDSISYSDAGEVELQGRAQDSARQVRVYLDNRSVASLDVTASGNWRGSLPEVDTGVYTLRIDEVDAGGRVTSRVETPFKREAPEVLAAATARVSAQVSAITVQRGDTLWAISRERYGDGILYVRVFEANRDSIRDPDLIYPGQIFSLPPG